MVLSHMLDANSHKIIAIIVSHKEVFLLDIDEQRDNIKRRKYDIYLANSSCDRFFIFSGVESGRNKPAVQGHCDELLVSGQCKDGCFTVWVAECPKI